MHKMDDLIRYNGAEWRVIGVGATRADGLTYYHLASTTEFVGQRNGRRPRMIGAWI